MKKKRSDSSRYLFSVFLGLMVVLISGCGGGDEDNGESVAEDLTEKVEEAEQSQSNDYYHLVRAEHDFDKDGSIEYVETFTSDVNGNLTRWESYLEDGQIQHVATFSYDSHANLTKEEWDSAAEYLEPPKLVDGVIDGKTHFLNTYDESDNLVKVEVDRSVDGLIDSVILNQYNVNGQLTKRESKYDWDKDGVIEYAEIAIYTYHADGQLATLMEPDGSGRFYTYGNHGKLTKTVSQDQDGSKSHYLYAYDANGRLIQEGVDKNQDGSIDVVGKSYSYDVNGQLTQKEEKNWDGSTSLKTYTHDANRNVITETNRYGNMIHYTWQLGSGYSNFFITDPCLLVKRRESPEEKLFDSVFLNKQ